MIVQRTKQEEVAWASGNIAKLYQEWKDIYEFGSGDKGWFDGIHLDTARRHITYMRSYLEELLRDQYLLYPDEYWWPLPKEVRSDDMAVTRKMNLHHTKIAKRTLFEPYESMFDRKEVFA